MSRSNTKDRPRRPYFAPGQIEHHRARHVRHLARWMGRVLGLLAMAAVLAAAVSIYWRGGA